MHLIAAEETSAIFKAFARLIEKEGLGGKIALCPDGAGFGPVDAILWQSGSRIPQVSAKVLIAAGEDAVHAAQSCKADTVITCGRSCRDTMTPSSVLEGQVMATLQRSITSLSGKLIEPGECDVSHLCGTVEQKMMLAIAKLITETF